MKQLLQNPRPDYMEFTVLSLMMCCCQVAEDGLSASKPGAITAAAASLVSEMSNIDQVYSTSHATLIAGLAVLYVCLCMCLHSMRVYERACVRACVRACMHACLCFDISTATMTRGGTFVTQPTNQVVQMCHGCQYSGQQQH